jgi:hypothetical protein
MNLKDFSDADRNVIRECLRAAVSGPFFPLWEFHTLFGLDHQAVADIACGVDSLDDSRPDVRLAIGGALSNLTGYPHRQPRETWDRFISAAPEEVRRIAEAWLGAPAYGRGGDHG